MGENMFNLQKLSAINEFDAVGAKDNFPGLGEYFDRLTEFLENANKYLSVYNPTVVVYSDDVRKDFINDCSALRKQFSALHLTPLIAELDNLQQALDIGNEKVLADGIVKFRAVANIVFELLQKTREDTPQQKIILAVDDEPEMLTVITSVLKDKHKIIAVTGGLEALALLNKYKPDVFLLDIEMPGMDGYELAGYIRQNESLTTVPILFLTGKATRQHVLKAKEIGAASYILKPIDKSVLLRKIDELLG